MASQISPRRFQRSVTRSAGRGSIEGEYAKGKHLPSLEAERHTLAELLDRYEPELTPKRRKAVDAQLASWRASIGDKKLSELTPAVLRGELDRLAKEPYRKAVPWKAVTLTRTATDEAGRKDLSRARRQR